MAKTPKEELDRFDLATPTSPADLVESVEVWKDHQSGWLRCEFGDISLSNVWPDKPGVVEDVGALILVTAPYERDAANLAPFGVELTVQDGISRMRAHNGTWLHRLQPAHWRDGIVPAGWSERIMLGRQIDSRLYENAQDSTEVEQHDGH